MAASLAVVVGALVVARGFCGGVLGGCCCPRCGVVRISQSFVFEEDDHQALGKTWQDLVCWQFFRTSFADFDKARIPNTRMFWHAGFAVISVECEEQSGHSSRVEKHSSRVEKAIYSHRI